MDESQEVTEAVEEIAQVQTDELSELPKSNLSEAQAGELIREKLFSAPEPAEAPQSEPQPEPEPDPDSALVSQYLSGQQQAMAQELQNIRAMEADPELNALRQTNPGEWTARKQEIQQRKQRLEATAREFNSQVEGYQQQVFSTALQKEEKKLLNKIPAWRDPEIRERESKEIVSYLRKQGYTDEQIAKGSQNAQTILLTRKAMLQDRGPKRPKRSLPRKRPSTQAVIKKRNLPRHSLREAAIKITRLV